jgi:hypothetical protein
VPENSFFVIIRIRDCQLGKVSGIVDCDSTMAIMAILLILKELFCMVTGWVTKKNKV